MRWLAVLLLLPACAAARSTYFLVTAERTYQSALEDDTEKKAPYEITLAAEYLQKAKEENNYADYGAAERLAKASMDHAKKAVERATLKEMDEEEEALVPEEKPEEVKEPEKENDLDDIDLDEI